MSTRDWARIVERIRVVRDADERDAMVRELTAATRPRIVAFANAHAMNSAAANADFCDALLQADLLLRDGSGMAILYRSLGMEPGLNMNGTDLIPRLIAAFGGRRVAFWGTREPFAGKAAAACQRAYGVQVVSVLEGFAPDAVYLDEAMQRRPELIVLGMGMPRQEALAAMLRDKLDAPVVIACGGAILDFLGGKVQRAPEWLRRNGMEWTYRLAREPRRLFRRYVLGNPAFLVKVLAWRFSGPSERG